MIKIYPSLIAANLLELGNVIKTLEPVSDGFHIDVMDNHFVPNLTWGQMFVNRFVVTSNKPLFVHLMVTNPESFIQTLSLRTLDSFCFHIETTNDPEKLISSIRDKKWKPAIAIKPNTALEEIFPFLGMIDKVLLMSVNPGHSGQQFMPSSIQRLDTLAKFKKEHALDFEIAMDGGINESNIGELKKRGATEFGIASAIFDSYNPIKMIEILKSI